MLEKDLGRDRRAAEVLEILADNYSRSAGFDSAMNLYALGAQHFRAAADRRAVRRINLKIAALDQLLGREREAFERYTEALRLARVFEDEEGVREIQWAMLPTLRALDRVEVERRTLEELQQSYSDSREVDMLARVHLEAGLSHYQREEYQLAVQRFMRSVTLAGQTHDSVLTGNALLQVGVSYDGMGNTQQAFQYYSDALKVSGSLPHHGTLRLEILTRVANGYLQYRQYDDARRFYRLALRTAIGIGNKIAEGYLTIQLGHCSVRSDFNESIRAYTSALSLFGDLGYARGTAYALGSLGSGYSSVNQLTTAIDHLKRAVEEFETVEAPAEPHDVFTECERAVFGSSSTYLYQQLTDLLLVTGRYDEAFWYQERKNRYHLYRTTGSLAPSLSDEWLAAEMSRHQHLRELRVGAERWYEDVLVRGNETRRFFGEVKDTLSRRGSSLQYSRERLSRLYPKFDPLLHIDGVGLVEVQKTVPRGAALVAFVPAREALYAFVVTNEKVSVQLAAVQRERLLATVGELLDVFHHHEADADSVRTPQSPDPRTVEKIQTLSGWLVRPILQEIRELRHLVVVMPAQLSWLPFHVLRAGRRARSPYVAEEHLVSYLPAASLMKLETIPLAVVQNVVGMGFAGAAPWDVEYELRDVRAFYKDTRLYFNEKATLQNLQVEQADVLHLSAPFTVGQQYPGNSYVLLSDGKSIASSAQVLLGDLFSLPVSPTVVISNLSRGGTVPHASIPYICFANGSRVVIMTGFVPSRKAKRYFGELFYTGLLSGKTSATAFWQVQQGMMKNPEYSSPHIWGGFFLWGK
jgi:tetratricopeptide (TPR) repeat protein